MERLASTPRFAGSESESTARKLCATHLEQSRLSTIEQPFDFSEFPGKYGVPFAGLLLTAAPLLSAIAYFHHDGSTAGLLALGVVLLTVLVVSQWLTRYGTSRTPWRSSRSANLIARRGNPTVWLVAHLDSKSQTIPMLVRITSIVLTVMLLAALAGFFVAGETGASVSNAVVVCGIAAAIASLPLVVCFTGNHSPGAADNASGVITILLTARMLRARPDLGVIITSGEELGLAGARFFVASEEKVSVALNCDTVDDNGRFVCMTRGERGLAAPALTRAAARLGLDVRVGSMLPGILADSMAFTDAGWDSFTLSRGNIATLARVHTSRDTAAAVTGTGIAKAARLLAATIEELN